MTNIFHYDDYRMYVRDAIAKKQTDSARKLSLRSIAYKMDLSPAYLSTVMNKKKHLSVDTALKVAEWLDLSTTETEYLTGMIQVTHETDNLKIGKIQKRLDGLAHSHRRKKIEAPNFDKILDLNHISTLVLMSGAHSSVNASDLSKILDLPLAEAEKILLNLAQHGLIKLVDHKYVRSENCSHLLQSAAPSAAIRTFYKQMLDRSKWAIDNLPMQDRIVGTETIILDAAQVKEAESIIEECFNRITALSQEAKLKNSVYALGIQLCKLTSGSL
ncbi:TIGR02147 family protein [Pseudobdellovibrio sp. HCB154]|uniref:TIGR02147 family protein n=1 Tax=Pseudobdellovibrio sp. HCB154 TaxID=3386277 RepID=UPI00391720B8